MTSKVFDADLAHNQLINTITGNAMYRSYLYRKDIDKSSDFRLFSSRCVSISNSIHYEVKGAAFIIAKSGPNKGKRTVRVPQTTVTVNFNNSDIKALQKEWYNESVFEGKVKAKDIRPGFVLFTKTDHTCFYIVREVIRKKVGKKTKTWFETSCYTLYGNAPKPDCMSEMVEFDNYGVVPKGSYLLKAKRVKKDFFIFTRNPRPPVYKQL